MLTVRSWYKPFSLTASPRLVLVLHPPLSTLTSATRPAGTIGFYLRSSYSYPSSSS
ncbi:hypothetical protein PF011_g15702 [Phytophthora fragariae]|uniref:Uncharacterized protein n=1 Tax=Phytophthora fragariae TaxID=53985 RepID=A0A6A3JQ05_9STRA|nr:hypothetical protein PF011_g15702 [Phytophthora fragariae]